jgi:MoxR-like ATPase
MSVEDREEDFLNWVEEDPDFTNNTALHAMFGVSNAPRPLEGGFQLGTVNLEELDYSVDGIVLASRYTIHPSKEMWFAAYFHDDFPTFCDRLNRMEELGEASGDTVHIPHSERNNNVRPYLTEDGQVYLANSGYLDSLEPQRPELEPGVEIDKLAVAIHPPTSPTRQGLVARQWISYLEGMIGSDRLQEVQIWQSEELPDDMRTHPLERGLGEIKTAIEEQGGFFSDEIMRRYHVGLNHLDHKHFVILTGLSGTGKTSLAMMYARAVHGIHDRNEEDPLFFPCPVRPDWTDPSGLTGYYDPLSEEYIVPPFLQAVLTAHEHPDSPVFVLIDEMNLARVEYYFSDVLSAIETGEPISLHENSDPATGSTGEEIPPELPMPANLYITGTVNIDETTHPFSDKVLDRAVTIDTSDIDIEGFLEHLETQDPTLREAIGASNDLLVEMWDLLEPHGQGFGYRVTEEIIRYLDLTQTEDIGNIRESLDHAIAQKILVTLSGSQGERELLNDLESIFERESMPECTEVVSGLREDLDEMGSFQSMR